MALHSAATRRARRAGGPGQLNFAVLGGRLLVTFAFELAFALAIEQFGFQIATAEPTGTMRMRRGMIPQAPVSGGAKVSVWIS